MNKSRPSRIKCIVQSPKEIMQKSHEPNFIIRKEWALRNAIWLIEVAINCYVEADACIYPFPVNTSMQSVMESLKFGQPPTFQEIGMVCKGLGLLGNGEVMGGSFMNTQPQPVGQGQTQGEVQNVQQMVYGQQVPQMVQGNVVVGVQNGQNVPYYG